MYSRFYAFLILARRKKVMHLSTSAILKPTKVSKYPATHSRGILLSETTKKPQQTKQTLFFSSIKEPHVNTTCFLYPDQSDSGAELAAGQCLLTGWSLAQGAELHRLFTQKV